MSLDESGEEDKEKKSESGEEDTEKKPKLSRAEIGAKIAESRIKRITRDQNGTSVAVIEAGSRRECMAIGSDAFDGWLLEIYEEATERLLPSKVAKEIIDLLMARASANLRKTGSVTTFRRVGFEWDEDTGECAAVYVDRGTPDWSAWKVTKDRIEKVQRPAVFFLRDDAAAPLAEPVLDDVRDPVSLLADGWSFNRRNAQVWSGWAFSTFMPSRGVEKPILTTTGPQGSGKSTLIKFTRDCIDPRVENLGSPIHSHEDFAMACASVHVLVIDNTTGFQRKIWNAIAQASCGGGTFKTRKHHSQTKMARTDFSAHLILSGIVRVADQGDVADRAWRVELGKRDKKRTLTEAQARAKSRAMLGPMLGAILTGVMMGLRKVAEFEGLPGFDNRMKGSQVWAEACGSAWWKFGEFSKALDAASLDARRDTLGDSARATALGRIVEEAIRLPVEFTTADLMREMLRASPDEAAAEIRERGTRGLGTWLAQNAPLLDSVGVAVESYRTNKARGWRLDKAAHKHDEPHPQPPEENGANRAGSTTTTTISKKREEDVTDVTTSPKAENGQQPALPGVTTGVTPEEGTTPSDASDVGDVGSDASFLALQEECTARVLQEAGAA